MSANKPGDPSPETMATLIKILGPFNKTGAELKPETRFSEDLNFDSLVVMEFIAVVEDDFDISVPLNILPDIATLNDMGIAIEKIVGDEKPVTTKNQNWERQWLICLTVLRR